MSDSRSMLLGAALALLGGVVGAVLATAVFTATDEDGVSNFPEAAAAATPTPCENLGHLALIDKLSETGKQSVGMFLLRETEKRFNDYASVVDKCLEYANR